MNVIVDATNVTLGSSVSSMSWHHIISGRNPGAIVSVISNGTSNPNKVNWSLIPMKMESSIIDPLSFNIVSQWSIKSPITGTISVGWASAKNAICASTSFKNTNQSTLVSNAKTSSGALTNINLNISSTSTEMVIDCISYADILNRRASAGAQQVQRFQKFISGTTQNAASSTESGSSTVVLTWQINLLTPAWTISSCSIAQEETSIYSFSILGCGS